MCLAFRLMQYRVGLCLKFNIQPNIKIHIRVNKYCVTFEWHKCKEYIKYVKLHNCDGIASRRTTGDTHVARCTCIIM